MKDDLSYNPTMINILGAVIFVAINTLIKG